MVEARIEEFGFCDRSSDVDGFVMMTSLTFGSNSMKRIESVWYGLDRTVVQSFPLWSMC